MRRWFQVVSAWIYKDASEWRPGYWGNLPYLLVLRCLVAAGVWLRFRIHSDHPLPVWTYALLLAAIVVSVLLHWPAREQYSRRIYGLVVATDVVVISAAYWFTGNAKSDFYLFYYLPLFTAAEYLSFRWVAVAFLASTAAFGWVVFDMPLQPPYADGTP